MSNLKAELAGEVNKIYRKLDGLETDVYNRIEKMKTDAVDNAKKMDEQALETCTSLLASTLEDVKKEIKVEFDMDINKKIESKFSGLLSSSTPGLVTPGTSNYMFHEYSKPKSVQKIENKGLPKDTTALHDITKPTQRPTTFDGKSSWDAYKTQFEIVSEINGWDDGEKAAFLAASLQGQAVTVLNCLSDSNRRDYESLVRTLDSRYETLCQSELNRATLRNRTRRSDESLPELAGDIERLVRLAYPNGSPEMLEALAKDHFVDAVQDDEICLRIAQGRPTTLRQALEIALELESFALASKRQSRYVREVRMEEPRDNFTHEQEHWNGVLNQSKFYGSRTTT